MSLVVNVQMDKTIQRNAALFTGWRAQDGEDFRGVKEKRSCTDLYCLLILVMFIGCWVGIGYYG